MDIAIELARQTGVVLRREAIEFGLTDRDLRYAVRHHRLVRIRQGAYTLPELWEGAFPEERHLIRCESVRRTLRGEVAFTHASALVIQGVAVWGVDLTKVHVTRLDGAVGRTEHGVVHHVGRFDRSTALQVGAFLTSHPAAAVIETSTLTGVEGGLVAADSALNKGLTTAADLRDCFVERMRWPNSRSTRLVVAMADGRAESPGETRMRVLCWTQHLPAPDLQIEIHDASGKAFARTDFGWERHGVLGEFDGRQKYGRLLKPGQKIEDVIIREKMREDKIREITGSRFIRYIWADLSTPAATAMRTRQLLRIAA